MIWRVSLVLATGLLFAFLSTGAMAEERELLDGFKPLSAGDLGALHGGFETPAGLQFTMNTSFLAAVTANGGSLPDKMAADAAGGVVRPSFSFAQGGTGSLLENSLNSVTLQQITQIDVHIQNYSQIQAQMGALTHSLANLARPVR